LYNNLPQVVNPLFLIQSLDQNQLLDKLISNLHQLLSDSPNKIIFLILNKIIILIYIIYKIKSKLIILINYLTSFDSFSSLFHQLFNQLLLGTF